MTVKILGIIPARFASTRFPGKPLFPIQGKSLLQRTFENARNMSILDHVLIATDHDQIFEHAVQFGGDVVMTSVECPNGTERLAEVMHQHPRWKDVDVIVNIQGDEPCVAPQAVEAAVQALLEDPTAHMATVVIPLKTEEEAWDPSIVKCVFTQQQHALYFSRTLIPSNKQHAFDPKKPYYRHVGLYAYRPDFLLHYPLLFPTPLQEEEDLEQLKILEHGYRIKVAVTEHMSFGVDTPEDVHKVEQWLCKQNTFL